MMTGKMNQQMNEKCYYSEFNDVKQHTIVLGDQSTFLALSFLCAYSFPVIPFASTIVLDDEL